MRFFTQQWLDEMTDQQAEEICREYLAHIEKLELPSSVSELANLYTHDAWIL